MRKILQYVRYLQFLVLVSLSWVQPPLFAEESAKKSVDLFGDFRFRLESDWDSERSDASLRDDRTRARVRVRLGLEAKLGDRWRARVRLRSGPELSQQSPHVTLYDLDGNDRGAADFNLDQWLLKVEGEKIWGWIGRGGIPFWKQNELYWDDDVTPVGLVSGYKNNMGESGTFELQTGHFTLPVGMRNFSGYLGVAQVVYTKSSWTIAAGWLDFNADPDDADGLLLLRGNGQRDYSLWIGSVQKRLTVARWPFTLGVDVLLNRESYEADDPDPFTAAHRDETDGVVGMVQFGNMRKKGDWLISYYYARVEALAVNGSYAGDDWLRWGSATETRATDFTGHELRLAKAWTDRLNWVARFYVVKSLTTSEDGKRFRLDFNVRF